MVASMKSIIQAFLLTLVLNTSGISIAQEALERASVQPFGTLQDGRNVQLFTLVNEQGMSVRILDLGGIIVGLTAADFDGNFVDVTTGFDNPQPYANGAGFMGAIVGRFANRIANGKFSLDGAQYSLAQNNGKI